MLISIAIAAAIAAAEGPSFETRVEAQRAIEEVYWRHRIWPAENSGPKPPLEGVLPAASLRERLLDGDRKVLVLERLFGRTIAAVEIQAEIGRIARSTQDPARLREILAALGNDADAFGDVVVRPLLADRLLRAYAASETPDFDRWWAERARNVADEPPPPVVGHSIPEIGEAACTPGTWSAMLRDFPTRRAGHVAVWTGSEMLIWGDRPGGFRYDPATDAWTPMSTLGEPAPRGDASAFWTGSRLLVVGGGSSTSFPPNVFYDPTTDTWSSGSAPAGANGRSGASVVWTGSGVLVWGGLDRVTFQPVQTGLRWDLATDTWAPTSTLGAPSARSFHAATWTGSRMVVFGGDTTPQNRVGTDTGGRYDPVADTWATMATQNAPSPRVAATSVWTGSRMIVWAGIDCDADTGVCEVLNDGAKYDPAANSWSRMTTNAPPARHGAPAVWTGTDMIVFGGYTEGEDFAAGGARYDDASNRWFPLSVAGSPTPRVTHTLVWSGTEAIVWGGQDGSDTLDTGARYRPATDTWIPTHPSNRPLPRVAHSAVWSGSELLIWGGNLTGGHELGAGGRYDPALDAWTPMSLTNEPAAPRTLHSAVWTGTAMIVWGGSTAFGVPLDTGGVYAVASNVWTPIPSTPSVPARMDHRAVWSGSRMLLFGGRDSTSGTPTYFGDGWSYDPAAGTWNPLPGSGAPSPRALHASAWTGSSMLVWGGFDGGFPNTGARFDPSANAWSPIAPLNQQIASLDAAWSGLRMFVFGESSSNRWRGFAYDALADAWTPMTEVGEPATTSPPRGIEWACDRAYSIGSIGDGNASYDPGLDRWTPIAKSPQAPWLAQNRDVVAAGSRLLVWPGDNGEAYCGCSDGPAGARVTLFAGGTGAKDRLTWFVAPAAVGYDLVRGDLATLRSTGGDFVLATGTCLANDTTSTSFTDGNAPAPGGFWYLVRASFGGSSGSYDSGAAKQVGSRDGEIAASGVACP
ncbi:MAG TPA: kelch repeat-containing protein [Candidatus Polarisedimenticolaceae bacterium]